MIADLSSSARTVTTARASSSGLLDDDDLALDLVARRLDDVQALVQDELPGRA